MLIVKWKMRCLLYSCLIFLKEVSAFSFPQQRNVNQSSYFYLRSPSTSFKTTTSLSFFNNKAVPVIEEIVIPGVGDEGCALESPSKINTYAQPVQAGIVFATLAGLCLASIPFSNFLSNISSEYEWVQTWRYSWPLLGIIYIAAGITHFTIQEEYENIYPSWGSWGFWYLPGSKAFHVQWTGVAEILGGLGLVFGGALDAFKPVYFECPNVFTNAGILSDSAAGLLLLTIAVSPANIFMFTHGAKLPKDGPEVPIIGHAIRGVLQIILLGFLYQMGEGSFDALNI